MVVVAVEPFGACMAWVPAGPNAAACMVIFVNAVEVSSARSVVDALLKEEAAAVVRDKIIVGAPPLFPAFLVDALPPPVVDLIAFDPSTTPSLDASLSSDIGPLFPASVDVFVADDAVAWM